jgi:hypothetical protein
MLSERTWHHDVGSNYEKIFHEQIIFLGLIKDDSSGRRDSDMDNSGDSNCNHYHPGAGVGTVLLLCRRW